MRRRGGLALAVLLALALTAVGVGGDEVDAGISSGTRNGEGRAPTRPREEPT